jgi:hypothetical protein
MVLEPLLLSAWFALCPQYRNPRCPALEDPAAVSRAFQTANPALLGVFLVLTVLVPFIYPLSYLGLGLLGLPRAPWLSLLGIAFGWLGSIPWGLIADQIFVLDSNARLGTAAALAQLEPQYGARWEILVFFAAWVAGHLLGYALLAIALWRAGSIPRWAAALLLVGAVLMGPVAYPTR